MSAAVAGLAVLAAGGALVLVALVRALTRPAPDRGRPPATLGCALAAAVLLVLWVVLTSRDAVRADETGTTSTVYSQLTWWGAAVVAALASFVPGRSGRRR